MARGRKPGFRMSDEHRTKIANSQILKCLIEHAEGRREMSGTQVTAGLGLLKKVLPDMTQADITSDGEKIEMPTVISLVAAKLPDDRSGD